MADDFMDMEHGIYILEVCVVTLYTPEGFLY